MVPLFLFNGTIWLRTELGTNGNHIVTTQKNTQTNETVGISLGARNSNSLITLIRKLKMTPT